jgi:hypothetical protein
LSVVGALPAALSAPFLFLVPGLVFLAILRRADREDLALDESLFLATASSVCASAWVGIVLAELGIFSLPRAAMVLGVGSALAALAARRRLAWPLAMRGRGRDLAATALVLAIAVPLFARPSQYIVGGRDPGAYVAAMAVIARTGGIVYADPAVLAIPPEDVELFYRNVASPAYSWSRFMGFDLERPSTGRVVPQFFHLFPVFGAYLFQALGIKGALATPPVFAILGVVAVLLTLRRVLGSTPALVASVLLCVNVIQVWFARYPVSETVSQFLIFTGLLAAALWEERDADAFGVLAGIAFGLSLLVRIDSVLVLLPVAIYVAGRLLMGTLAPRRAAALLVPLALLAVHAAAHAAVFAPKYLRDVVNRPYWRFGALTWGTVLVALAVLAIGAWRYRARASSWLRDAGTRWLPKMAAALVLLAAYAYFVRPVLSAWAGADGTDPAASTPAAIGAALAQHWRPGLLDLLGFRRLAAHDAGAFLRLGWFVSPLALAAGVLGLAALLRHWRPRAALLVLTALVFSLFYFYKIRVYNDYFFALRRFMPVIVPALLGFAAHALELLWARGRWRRAAAAAWGIALVVLYAWQTAPLLRYTDWNNAVRFVGDVARRFGPEDVVIFEQPRSVHLLSLPLWSAHGVQVLELARFNPDPERLRHLVESWRGRYRNVYFVHTYRTDLCGLFLERVTDYSFGTYEWERAYGRAPRGPVAQSLSFTLSRLVTPDQLQVPALPEVDVGGSDDVQVSGFFDKERDGERSYRWTGGCASVFVPGAAGARTVTLTLSPGLRPPPAPVVHVSLSGVPLGDVVPGPAWSEATLALPDPLPSGPPVLRLDVRAWRPANTNAADTDIRDLGVQVDRIRFDGGR